MPSTRPATTIRFTEEDRVILDKLHMHTGLDSAAAIVRLALREALAARERPRKK